MPTEPVQQIQHSFVRGKGLLHDTMRAIGIDYEFSVFIAYAKGMGLKKEEMEQYASHLYEMYLGTGRLPASIEAFCLLYWQRNGILKQERRLLT